MLTNRQQADLYFEVLEGKTIQIFSVNGWIDLSPDWHVRIRGPRSDMASVFSEHMEYRVKPEPGVVYRLSYQYSKGGMIAYSYYPTLEDGKEHAIGPYYVGMKKFVEVIE